MEEKQTGRPSKEFNKKDFVSLIGLGCSQEEICWFFRDDTGKPANKDTLSRWCVREFGMTFQEYSRQNGLLDMKIRLRRAQMKLAEKSAVMAIFLGKNILGQSDNPSMQDDANELIVALTEVVKKRNDSSFTEAE